MNSREHGTTAGNGGNVMPDISALIRTASRQADATASRLPPVDVAAIMDRAADRHGSPFRWVPRFAAAAAVLALAMTSLLVLVPKPTPAGPVPAYMTALVDSLYPENDYIHDELADIMGPVESSAEGTFMAGVWDSVIVEIDAR